MSGILMFLQRLLTRFRTSWAKRARSRKQVVPFRASWKFISRKGHLESSKDANLSESGALYKSLGLSSNVECSSKAHSQNSKHISILTPSIMTAKALRHSCIITNFYLPRHFLNAMCVVRSSCRASLWHKISQRKIIDNILNLLDVVLDAVTSPSQ
jgi:hypothetical protein